MTYLIDGHNLIPKIPGLRLDQLDDEQGLISLLSSFCEIKNCHMEVIFDAGRVGEVRHFNHNRLKVHFVLPPAKADDAILLRLIAAKRSARNFIVVTSDRQVQERSRRSGAQVISSSIFARTLLAHVQPLSDHHQPDKSGIQDDEISYWEDLFSGK